MDGVVLWGLQGLLQLEAEAIQAQQGASIRALHAGRDVWCRRENVSTEGQRQRLLQLETESTQARRG